MDVSAFLGAMVVFFFIVCPVAGVAIWYDMGRDQPWRPALKWALILFVVVTLTSTVGYAQMISDIYRCGNVDGFWWWAGGCFLAP